jgi:flagellar motor switch protein FliM
MSPPAEDSLLVLQTLARATGASDRPIHADVDSLEYDWQVPYHFGPDQLARVNELGGALAQQLAEAIGQRLRTETPLQADPARQCFGGRLHGELSQRAHYQLTLGAAEGPCGVIALSAGAAVEWVARLLGGPVTQTDKQLSELEGDLLADAVAVVVKTVCQALREAGGPDIRQVGEVCPGPTDLPGDRDTEYCAFVFRRPPGPDQAEQGEEAKDANQAGEGADAPFLTLGLFCEVLDPVVGRGEAEGPASAAGGAPEQNRAAMLEHFARAAVTAVAMAGNADLTMREVMDLEAGDVLLLAKRADDPIEVYVDATPVSCGRAVVASGRYAVEILRVYSPREGGAAARRKAE